MLELKNICFEVHDDGDRVILKDINLTVGDGRFVAVTGPNGSGKSTLAKIIAGIQRPVSGSILLDGEAKELLKDEDMVNTAEEFLENNLNVSETARNLYMHRNTLMYRLDKIERVMGLNLRNFSDAVTFRVITILYKLT